MERPSDDMVKRYVDAHGKVAAIKIAVELGVPLADVAESLRTLAEKGHLRIESTAKMPRLKLPPAPTFGRQRSIFTCRHLESGPVYMDSAPIYAPIRKLEQTPEQQAYMKKVRELRKIKEEFLRAKKEQPEV